MLLLKFYGILECRILYVLVCLCGYNLEIFIQPQMQDTNYKNYSIFYQLSCNSMLATEIDFTQNLNHKSTTHL